MTEAFDADWLALRESFDARARSAELAQAFADALPARPHVLDLGAGTGSMFRWLAPRIGRPQHWTFVDADRELLEIAAEMCAAWAEQNSWRVSDAGRGSTRALILHTPRGAWRIEHRVADLGDGAGAVIGRLMPDAVSCSALLDLVSARWLRDLAAALRGPFLACLSVDGRDAFRPVHPTDRLVARGFRRDQARDKGFGAAAGHTAWRAAAAMLRARGFRVAVRQSDWRIARDARAMLTELVAGHANAAARALRPCPEGIADWLAVREAQAARGRLAIRIGHRDILAVPEGTG